MRTVVLRKADKDAARLYCYTDLRSVKARQIEDRSFVSWLFWDADSRLQFTASGPAYWLDRDEAEAVFNQLPKHSRKAYATVDPPSTPLTQAGSGLPNDWEQRTVQETDYARPHFGVLVTQLNEAEVLRLDRGGNIRLVAHRKGDEWDLQWAVP